MYTKVVGREQIIVTCIYGLNAGDFKELSKKFKLWRNILKFVFRNFIDGMGSGYWHTGIR